MSLGELWSYMSTSEFPQQEQLFFHHLSVASGEGGILLQTGRADMLQNYYLSFKLEQLEVKINTKEQIHMPLSVVY